MGTIGVKLVWTEDELNKLPEIAAKPSRFFDDRAQAADWFLKLSGLLGVVEADSPLIESGIVQDQDGWRVCQDPKSILVVEGSPPFSQMFDGLLSPVYMALGEHDPLVSPDDHAEMPTGIPHVFGGLGHNVMVEDPDVVWSWFSDVASLI